MWLYNKTFIHQNREAKITALACLLFGGLFYGFGNTDIFPAPVIFQLVGVILIVCSVYLATAYILKQYSVSISKNDNRDGNTCELYDLIVRERKGKREPKVCHIELDTIISVKIVTKKDLKKTKSEKLNGFRYIYDTKYAWKERIEITALTGDYQSVIYLSYDDKLFEILSESVRDRSKEN